MLVDWPGSVHEPAGPGARIISLVPSITELLCDLGLAGGLVGRAGFCIHPRVDRVLLASEPYRFRGGHVDEVAALLPGANVSPLDGELTSWYGSRAIQGLRYLDQYADRSLGPE